MKKILIVLPNDKLGGAEQYLKNLAFFFSEKGYYIEVLFLTAKCSGGWDDMEFNRKINLVFTVYETEFKGLSNFLKNILKVRNVKFDYVFSSHVHLTGVIGFLIKINLLKKNKFVGRESTSIFRRFAGRKLLLFKVQYLIGYVSLDLLICQTDFMRNQLTEALPWLSRRINIQVIPNPVNFNNISFNDKIDVKFDEFIVSAGRLIPEKGFDVLIKAFKVIKYKFPNFKLIILGEGEKRLELERLIQDLELNNDVFLSGFVKNVYPYFKKAKVCVVSSRIEGFPNVLLQMMSQNTKVVSTLCAGGIDKLEGVYSLPVNNSTLLAEKIITALNTETIGNIEKFKKELEKRSMDNFISQVNTFLNEKNN
jgi:glycosyltransferase involved in cell wall biosynthesis